MLDEDELLDHAVAKLSECVTTVYHRDPRKGLDHVGSGVLVVDDQRNFWILSAAHVLDHLEGSVTLVGLGDELVTVGGRMVRSRLPQTGRNADALDYGAVSLVPPPDAAFKALRSSAIQFSADIDVEDDLFLVLGYPRKKQGRVLGNETTSFVSPLLLPAKGLVAHPEQASPAVIELMFDRRRMMVEGRQQTSVHPRGMSGGAVFRLAGGLQGIMSPKLIAILTEYEASHRLVRATLVNLHIQAIESADWSA